MIRHIGDKNDFKTSLTEKQRKPASASLLLHFRRGHGDRSWLRRLLTRRWGSCDSLIITKTIQNQLHIEMHQSRVKNLVKVPFKSFVEDAALPACAATSANVVRTLVPNLPLIVPHNGFFCCVPSSKPPSSLNSSTAVFTNRKSNAIYKDDPLSFSSTLASTFGSIVSAGDSFTSVFDSSGDPPFSGAVVTSDSDSATSGSCNCLLVIGKRTMQDLY
ncbi:hypothetical protein BKA69DRAFT_662144 [Paraphysoderma sedebokerense]|nr:hypothetical protein BKA69DRAFT_662144 [Paraphysoderma sedebokerense]